ncbi:MAG: nucleotidyltransferase [Pseudomonadota bacterium]
MTLKELLLKSHEALSGSAVDHALIGGFALAALGVARATNDVDFLINETQKELAKKALTRAGWSIELETDEVIQFGTQGNLDLLIARRTLSKKMLENAKPIDSLGIKCLSAEAIIGLKIQAYKNDPKREFQDKADIQSLIFKYKGSLNWEEIKAYADLFGETAFIDQLKAQK